VNALATQLNLKGGQLVGLAVDEVDLQLGFGFENDLQQLATRLGPIEPSQQLLMVCKQSQSDSVKLLKASFSSHFAVIRLEENAN
jgi:superfamily II DNA/RNA helicase